MQTEREFEERLGAKSPLGSPESTLAAWLGLRAAPWVQKGESVGERARDGNEAWIYRWFQIFSIAERSNFETHTHQHLGISSKMVLVFVCDTREDEAHG